MHLVCILSFLVFYKNKKRQEFSSHAVTALLLDADSPSTNRVIINELIKHPTNQSFYL